MCSYQWLHRYVCCNIDTPYVAYCHGLNCTWRCYLDSLLEIQSQNCCIVDKVHQEIYVLLMSIYHSNDLPSWVSQTGHVVLTRSTYSSISITAFYLQVYVDYAQPFPVSIFYCNNWTPLIHDLAKIHNKAWSTQKRIQPAGLDLRMVCEGSTDSIQLTLVWKLKEKKNHQNWQSQWSNEVRGCSQHWISLTVIVYVEIT